MPRARDLEIEIGRLPDRTGERDHGRPRGGRSHEPDRGRERPHGGHRRHAAAGAAFRRLAHDKRQRRADGSRSGSATGHADDPDRIDEHALGRSRPRRADRVEAAGRVGLEPPVAVGETWDGFLNDINGFHVRPSTSPRRSRRHAKGRSRRDRSAAARAWCVTDSKAGSGRRRASSRTAGRSVCSCRRTTGCRVRLRVNGIAVGEAIGPDVVPLPASGAPEGGGSIIVVIATDAPLSRASASASHAEPASTARTGGMGERSSGDFALPPTGNRGLGADGSSSRSGW